MSANDPLKKASDYVEFLLLYAHSSTCLWDTKKDREKIISHLKGTQKYQDAGIMQLKDKVDTSTTCITLDYMIEQQFQLLLMLLVNSKSLCPKNWSLRHLM